MANHPQRLYPDTDVVDYSPNVSSRNGQKIRLIVLHATAGHNYKGTVDLKNLGSWFSNRSAQVSSHVATDNEGNSARYVRDKDKAWHCASYNGASLGIEQVMPGDGTEITEHMYRETARWIAWWNKKHKVPIRRARVAGGYVLRSGIATHSQLGASGGNHDDPGPRYDVDHVLRLARYYRKYMN